MCLAFPCKSSIAPIIVPKTSLENYSQFKDLQDLGNPGGLHLVRSNQRIVGGWLFTMLDDGKRHEKELAKIHDPMLSPSKKVFG
jgi:hypothetical protein